MMVLRDTHKLWQGRMRAMAAELGVPDSYRLVLGYLRRHPGANQKEIAAFRNITTASVSQIVKEMQYEGYLRKEVDAEDQRFVHLYLTEQGKRCAEKILDRVRQADAEITARLTPAREAELMALLGELSAILREEGSSCSDT